MKIDFTKMHDIDNDNIYHNRVDGDTSDLSKLLKVMNPRDFSFSSVSTLGICAYDVVDAKMRMSNLDRSEGKMCVNVDCCAGKYFY
ncbi:MAG: hypothetical protein HUJ51_02835 [Eggerthellaceae bacterium]|nr:hypothetical protein [Eggerthellaceae bacterium]